MKNSKKIWKDKVSKSKNRSYDFQTLSNKDLEISLQSKKRK